ncbi:hypothetical protein T09_14237 [Trichinella sp. T9]|nr:hypothetical protein T09_14237 [Trichinella sp. T9]
MVDRLSICKNDSNHPRKLSSSTQHPSDQTIYPLSTLDYTTADRFIFTTTLASTPIAAPRTRNHNATKRSFLYHADSFIGRDDDHHLDSNGAASLIRHPRGSTHTTGRCPVYCPLPTAMPSVRLPAVPRLPQTSSQLK